MGWKIRAVGLLQRWQRDGRTSDKVSYDYRIFAHFLTTEVRNHSGERVEVHEVEGLTSKK